MTFLEDLGAQGVWLSWAILGDIFYKLCCPSRSWGYDLSFLTTCCHLGGNMIAKMIQLRLPNRKYRGGVRVIDLILGPYPSTR